MRLYGLTLAEAKARLDQGEISAVELTQSYLQRIKVIEPTIKAFLKVDEGKALEAAEAADKRAAIGGGGVLNGLPIGIKDALCTQGLTTTCGSKMLEDFVPPYDATVIEKLREAGAVIIGKLSMDEFAMGSANENTPFQVPENPWKKGYVTGGSSGGSAAAVAADECVASLGSDTGGSVRQPASLCGVVGLKPTYGRVSRYGLVAFASSLDQVGPMTKDVTDCAQLLQVISGHDPKDSTSVSQPVPDYSAALTSGLAGMKVGMPKEYFQAGLDSDVEKAVGQGIEMLKEAGAEVVEVSLPHTRYCVAAYYVLAPAEASANLSRFDGVRYGYRAAGQKALADMYAMTRSTGFGPEVKQRIIMGAYALSSGYYDAYYRKAAQVRTLVKQDFQNAFQQCDLLVSPVSPTPAWQLGKKTDDPLALYLSDIFTLSANLTGIPGISVPVGISQAGLPIGLQLQASHFNESRLLQAAFNIEQRAGMVGQRAPRLNQ